MSMSADRPRLLLVEDEETQRNALVTLLRDEGFEVIAVGTLAEAVRAARDTAIAVVVTDFRLPDGTGLDVLRETKAHNPHVQVVLVTAYGTVDRAVEAMKGGAYDYLTKPIDVDKLLIILRRALEHRLLVSENESLRQALQERVQADNIIAASDAMQQVLNLAARVAPTTATVLIRGESGTGKEIIARMVHNASPRNKKPFVAFNAAALSPSLIESELFGHAKGAFTGAVKVNVGRFVEADGGTIFIDEVGDIPGGSQAKFLRVLQESSVEPVGDTRSIPVDIRVIAATNRNLEEMIQEGTFREDLYYRLNVITISIPPLRERKEDIGPLCEHFIAAYNRRNNRSIRGLSREAFAQMMKYDFPGNVRELENMIERAVILARDDTITMADLPPEVARTPSPAVSDSDGLDEKVSALERHLILSALQAAGGNQSRAARSLNISERKLRYKLQRMGHDPDRP
ncbi:MAG TPA: sigma-54 dependent transcriptional regulator [Acidobacteriota bacterium]|nr:sigma-54 dependent transcriptional regulator [Acidobacteriota bacterium]